MISTSHQPDRSTYLGGSDIAAILGLSPYKTPLDCYLDKVEGSRPITDPDKLKILERGKRLEPYILDMLCIERGVKIEHRNRRFVHEQHPFIAAEIDAETDAGHNVEAKSVSDYGTKAFGDDGSDEIPVYYTAQIMHGMGVTGAQSTLVPVLLGIDDFRVYQVNRDEELIKNIQDAEVAFWNQIQQRIAPSATTVSDIERLFPWDHGSVIQASDDIRDVALALKDLKKRIKLLEDDADEKATQIKLFMGEHQILQFGAAKLLSWKSQSANRFQVKEFQAAHPRIAEKFTKASTSRVMRLA